MCVPEVFIREDGRGFIVRKGGIDWEIIKDSSFMAFRPFPGVRGRDVWGRGDTIMEAVDNALAKIKGEKE